MNIVKVAVIQSGPNTEDKQRNTEKLLELVDEAGQQHPDFVLMSELATLPYFCSIEDDKFFHYAEPIDGPTIKAVAEKARQYHMHVITTIFEKTPDGVYYNSAVVVGPDGKVIEGTLPDGGKVPAYRKCHIPQSFDQHLNRIRTNEKYYFSPGPGIATFDTEKGRIGILICYDKRYFEAWRMLELMGAQIVFHPMATWGWKLGTLESEFRTFSCDCGFFIVDSGKGGDEQIEGTYLHDFVGHSVITNPLGEIVATGPDHVGPVIIYADLDMDLIDHSRILLPLSRDRRPELYSLLLQEKK